MPWRPRGGAEVYLYSFLTAELDGMGGQYQRPRTLKDVLHLPVEYTAQSNSWNDRKILGTRFSTLSFPRWKNISVKLACLKKANSYCYLIIIPHTLVNLTCHWEIFPFLTFLQMWRPLYNLWTKESYKIWSVIIGEISFASVWITKRHYKTFNALTLSKMQFSTLPVHGVQWRQKMCAKHGGNCGQLYWVLRVLRTKKTSRDLMFAIKTQFVKWYRCFLTHWTHGTLIVK